jgi:hypothetical protein
MTANVASARARRYLLGQANAQECAVIEQEYLEHDDAVDRIAAAEDDLIEDYLAGQLTPADRDRFERGYLSTPRHCVRVETIRRLMTQASPRATAHHDNEKKSAPSPRRVIRYGPWLALAASLLIVASLAFRVVSPFGRRELPSVENRTPLPSPAGPGDPAPRSPSNLPRTFALTISPATVRSSSESPAAVIPAGTDVVAIRLEGDADSRKLVARRVSIRTVGGDQAWQGLVVPEDNRPAGTAGRIDVPATRLPVDDYLVTLYGTDASGVEREWMQYFLRVRAR